MKKLLVTGFSLLCFPLLAQVLQPLGNGLPSRVVASFAAGNDYLALFHDSSTNPVQYTVARWNGSYWSYYPGLETPGIISGINGEKYHFNSVVLYKDTMYAGAYIESPTDVVANVDHLYKWDGSQWVIMSNTISSKNYGIMAMTVFDGKMIVAGRFQNTLGMGVVDNIAAYNGASWDFLGKSTTEQGTDGEIQALVVEGNRLYIGGSFQKFAGTITGNIAYYTATNPSWGGVGSPFSGTVEELASYNGVLAAIGRASSSDPAEVRVFKSSAWSTPVSFADFTTSDARTIAGAKNYLLIGGDFVKDGNGASLLRLENDTLFVTGNKITGDFKLGQRGSEAFVWGDFLQEKTGIRYISKIEAEAGEVAGYLFYDKDQNCDKGISEMGIARAAIRFVSTDNGKIYFAFSKEDGKFAIALPEGNYNVMSFPGRHWVASCGTSGGVKVREGMYNWLNLGQFMMPNTNDLELFLDAATAPNINAGDEINYVIRFRNTGNQVLNGETIHFKHSDRLSKFSSTPPAINYDSSKREATYTILNLQPGETRYIDMFVTLPIDATSDEKFTCDLKAGSLFTASDAYKADNFDTLIIGSRSSNNGSILKTGTSGDLVKVNVTRLDYTINFTNTSDEVVHRVVVTDSIDVNVVKQLQSLDVWATKSSDWYVENGVLVVEFSGIDLASNESNPRSSNAGFNYALMLSKPLQHNDKVYNTATADFDSKWQAHSNTVIVTMVDPNIGVRMVEANKIRVYPNPATSSINIELAAPYRGEVVMVDNSGRVVRNWHVEGSTAVLNTEGLNAGIYILRCGIGSAMVTISK